jgi:transcriptional regulator with XRE-family HTH domain
MGYPRPRPKHLANKLLQIRLTLGVSQGEMVRRLGLQNLIDPTSISKYETDKNEPPLAILLAYARAVGISTDTLIDDSLQLAFPESLTTPQEPVESRMSTVQSRMRIVVFPRQQPQKPLAEKLLQIREWLKLSQPEIVKRLRIRIDPTLISMYEHNRRQPPLNILLAYARIAGVPLEQIVDDELELHLSEDVPFFP